MLDGSLPRNECAIYLQHTNGVHYDVVKNVSGSQSNNTTENDKKRKKLNSFDSSDCHNEQQPAKKIKLVQISENNDNECLVTDIKENSCVNYSFNPINSPRIFVYFVKIAFDSLRIP